MPALNTRLLLTAAAIGVACGLLLIPVGPLHAVAIGAAPLFYGSLLGLYLLPGAIAQALLRTPGVAIVAAAVTGLIDMLSPLQGGGARALAYVALVGLVQEAVYALVRWRRWPLWPALVGAIIIGAVAAIAFHFAFDLGGRYADWVVIVQFVLTPAACVAVTLAGQAIAGALRAAGVARPAAPGR